MATNLTMPCSNSTTPLLIIAEPLLKFDRVPVSRSLGGRVAPPPSQVVHCKINATILNRPFKRPVFNRGMRGYSDGSRSIPNAEELIDALHKESNLLRIKVVVTERIDFSSIHIRKQFEVMQNTQILISVHGAELSNVLFLRRGASVSEVYPFRHTPTIFRDVLHALGIHHQKYIAKPDGETYQKCIYNYNKAGSPSRKAAELVVNQFMDRAANYSDTTNENDKTIFGTYFDDGWTVYKNRQCGRSQRLIVDATVLAKLALGSFQRVCFGDVAR
jgi:Glycosyltransferase 61